MEGAAYSLQCMERISRRKDQEKTIEGAGYWTNSLFICQMPLLPLKRIGQCWTRGSIKYWVAPKLNWKLLFEAGTRVHLNPPRWAFSVLTEPIKISAKCTTLMFTFEIKFQNWRCPERGKEGKWSHPEGYHFVTEYSSPSVWNIQKKDWEPLQQKRRKKTQSQAAVWGFCCCFFPSCGGFLALHIWINV